MERAVTIAGRSLRVIAGVAGSSAKISSSYGRTLTEHVDIRTTQLMLGHADIKHTQRYLNITDEKNCGR